ncbi:MAG: hypothetical protein WCD35_09420 [Mycobacteriales bacterium]
MSSFTLGAGHPSEPSTRPAWPLALVPLVVVPVVCVALLLRAAGLDVVQQLVWAFLALAVLVMLVAPRGLVSARTWVVGYLVLQFPVRALFLLTAPTERPPIYALFSPGVGMEAALAKALLQSLIGLALLAAAYLVASPRDAASRAPVYGATLRSRRVLALLLVGGLLLPLEARGVSGGSAFLLSMPGLAASGAAAAVCYSFVQRPLFYLWEFALAIAYTATRVTLLSSKMAVLACVVALVIGAVGRAHGRRPGRSAALSAVVLLLLGGVVAMYVFAVASGRDRGRGFVDTVSQGTSAAVSRSYGVDALMASNAHLDDGARPLYGASMVELASSWVPRALWPDKPKSFSIRFGEEVFAFSPGVGTEFFAPSYSGEWVLNFGTLGLLVGWVLFGLALARVDMIPSLAHRTLWLVSMVHLVEGSFVAQFWLAAPFIVGGYWALRKAPAV